MNRRKALIVDNDPVVSKFMTRVLEKRGYHVRAARDGLSALEILKEFVPDVAFVDLVMPNINGEKLCQIIRQNPKLNDLYLVIVSAIVAEQEIDLAGLGANLCIFKSSIDRLQKHIIAALDRLDTHGAVSLMKETPEFVGLEHIRPRHAMRELLCIKKHFEVILGGMFEGILEIESDGRIVYANPSAVSLIGTPEEGLLGTDIHALFGTDDRRTVEKLLKNSTPHTLDASSENSVILNGRHVLLNVLPIEDDHHKSTVIVLYDITERIRAEAQRKRMEMLEFTNDLTLRLMDELRNPLVAVGGFAARISNGDCPAGKLKEYTQLIFDESRRLDNVLEKVVGHLKNAAEQAHI